MSPRLRTSWVDADDLRTRLESWNFLADHSLSQNVAFESNYLLPAMDHLAKEKVRVLIVEDKNAEQHCNLIGLAPIISKRIYRLPFKAAEIWKHDQCFDATPLLHGQYAAKAWRLMCQQLVADGFSLLSLDTVSAEKGIDSAFAAAEKNNRMVRFQRDQYHRAAFSPSLNVDSYVKEHVSKKMRKNTQRLLRRLEDEGNVTWETSDDTSDYSQLTKDFLRIEASGWKGEEGTALASTQATKAFYESLIQESAKSGKARFLSLMIDGQPIAMLSDIQSGKFVYSFKTAYDNAFAPFSPGQQVEIKNLEFLHRDGIESCDSCTSSSNPTINRIWGQKLAFQSLILSLTPGAARFAVKALPLVQSAVHRLRKK